MTCCGALTRGTEPGRGCHDDSRRALRDACIARAGGGDLEVRRQAAVRVDFMRREGQDGALDLGVRQAFQRSEEKSRVGRQAVDLRIVGNHDHDTIARGRATCEHSLRRGVRPVTRPADAPMPTRPAGVFFSDVGA